MVNENLKSRSCNCKGRTPLIKRSSFEQGLTAARKGCAGQLLELGVEVPWKQVCSSRPLVWKAVPIGWEKLCCGKASEPVGAQLKEPRTH